LFLGKAPIFEVAATAKAEENQEPAGSQGYKAKD
jgi:hypothetical protein